MEKITLDDVKNNKEFSALIERANINLENIGYTEHGIRHVGYVSIFSVKPVATSELSNLVQ